MKERFFVGFKSVLPIILFIIIMDWAVDLIFSVIETLDSFRKLSEIENVDIQNGIKKLIWLIGIIISIYIFGWVIGIIKKFPKIQKYLEYFYRSVVDRIPILSHLYGITNQVHDLQKKSESFKSVVLVPIIGDKVWTVGFITTESSIFSKCFSDSEYMLSVYMPMTPLTSGLPVLIPAKYIKQTNVSVPDAIAYIATGGIAGATKKIEEQSRSV